MAGNSFGDLFKITTFGESHGKAIGVIIDGVPPNLELSEEDIQPDLDRRRPGQSKIVTQRKESDKVAILSGVFEGKTTGAALAMIIYNEDQRSKDYSNIKDLYRPGHADFTYQMKYGIRDYRGGGRSSGRETACRVAAGAVAKKILINLGIDIVAYTSSVADIQGEEVDISFIEENAVRAADPSKAEAMINAIEEARKEGDSLGGTIDAVVTGCPVGLGEPPFDKLNAKLAQALFSIATVKGLEFGSGFNAPLKKGSENNDTFINKDGGIRTKTNNAGGILGGISNGESITLRMAIKPTSSIVKKQMTVTQSGEEVEMQVKGRHDPCLCPRVVPVVEAMIAITILDCYKLHQSLHILDND